MGDDVPVLLRDVPGLFFPHGGMTLSALRTEAKKGRLVTIRIAGKDWVTPTAIREMLEQCRVERSRPVLKSEPNRTDEGSGSSETDSGIDAQTALSMKLERLKKGSGITSRKNASQTRQNVVPLRSG